MLILVLADAYFKCVIKSVWCFPACLLLMGGFFFSCLLFVVFTVFMTNLDSIFKSRDITLLTKVRLVKAMVFPVVMYGCESWTVKKAESRRIDAFGLWC